MLTDEDIARIRGGREPEPKRGPNPVGLMLVMAATVYGGAAVLTLLAWALPPSVLAVVYNGGPLLWWLL